jgi:hypothetical protein
VPASDEHTTRPQTHPPISQVEEPLFRNPLTHSSWGGHTPGFSGQLLQAPARRDRPIVSADTVRTVGAYQGAGHSRAFSCRRGFSCKAWLRPDRVRRPDLAFSTDVPRRKRPTSFAKKVAPQLWSGPRLGLGARPIFLGVAVLAAALTKLFHSRFL